MIWKINFKIYTHPCVCIGVLAEVWVEDVIKTPVEEFVTNLRAAVVIGKLSGVKLDVVIEVVFDIGVELVTDVNANVLVAAAIKFVMSSP